MLRASASIFELNVVFSHVASCFSVAIVVLPVCRRPFNAYRQSSRGSMSKLRLTTDRLVPW